MPTGGKAAGRLAVAWLRPFRFCPKSHTAGRPLVLVRYVRAARRPASTKRACSHPACTKPACTEIITDTDCPARFHREARCIGWQRGGDALRISPGFSIADKRSSRTNTDGFPHSAVSAGKCAGFACHWPRSLKSQVSPASPRAVAWPSSSKRLIAAAPRGPARDAGVAHRC